MAILSMKSAALALLAATAVIAQEGTIDEVPLNVMFVNQLPETSIDLYWENHALPDDHPDRRQLEGKIPPKGGWHATNTFNGHGESLFYIIDIY